MIKIRPLQSPPKFTIRITQINFGVDQAPQEVGEYSTEGDIKDETDNSGNAIQTIKFNLPLIPLPNTPDDYEPIIIDLIKKEIISTNNEHFFLSGLEILKKEGEDIKEGYLFGTIFHYQDDWPFDTKYKLVGMTSRIPEEIIYDVIPVL